MVKQVEVLLLTEKEKESVNQETESLFLPVC